MKYIFQISGIPKMYDPKYVNANLIVDNKELKTSI